MPPAAQANYPLARWGLLIAVLGTITLFTGTLTGVQAGDNITVTFTSTASATSDVGSYAITPVFNDPDGKLSSYTLHETNGVLTITKANQTITFGTLATKTYGDAPFGLTATASSESRAA